MIGIFDSGYGGLSVQKAVMKTLPDVPIVYFADHKFCPYGRKSKEELIERAFFIADALIHMGAQLIIVACNTATAAAIDALREKYDIPFVGMEPAIKPAAMASSTKKIGVLATEGTFSGRLFNQTKEKFAQDIEVVIQEGVGLVELVEKGLMGTYKAHQVLFPIVDKMKAHQIDQLVLGCTHYPFLKEDLQKMLGKQVQLIDPAPAVAQQAKRLYQNVDDKVTVKKYYRFITSGDNVKEFRRNVLSLITVDEENTLFMYE
ncbi:glutamate racemase [Flammeovirga pacifica]|uniref:Glutamate racemase n=1 Tax=Flammeovirga pacifica TaxID=915059 RepID=A0A1S1YZ31_FLAPC|nr:glutamate racemase [Flammeovirga pacifica]OHX66269.1 glutamate racemase [Flammeovirga pacifica]